MNDHRWGFEEGDEWDEVPRGREQPPSGPVEELTGSDQDSAVTVVVGPDAAVLQVRADPDWRRSVDPRALRHSVLAAANNATMRALAAQVDAQTEAQVEAQVEARPAVTAQPPAPPAMPADETPLTSHDIRRLLDAVTMELDAVTGPLAAVADRRITATSGGRHVSAAALRGQVVDVTVDANWAASARPETIESELLDVLGRLRRDGDTGELAARLHGSSAIAELNALAADPQALLRRIGLLPRNEES